MFEITKTETFNKWLKNLKDRRARAKVLARIDNIENGNFGDVEPVGEGVSESKINYGPGYRIYFKKIGSVVIVVLAAGTKGTQPKDIKRARALAKEYDQK